MQQSDDDIQLVVYAADMLRVSEWDIFVLAAKEWGNFSSEKQIDSEFTDYMFTGRAPYYVRGFARKQLDMCKNGRFN